MPKKLHIHFPRTSDGLPALDFVCDSGDFDPGEDFDDAVASVKKRLAPHREKHPAARVLVEDV